ncbi:MAG TPA: hypothetical protein PKM73_06375 [Verrucomicrobiota bacterium]|nr:hypothetical protein [Verrucomicrobiota bacterium]HNU51149.1 hypothetical protein [Verrucomicrobiota bacterium]
MDRSHTYELGGRDLAAVLTPPLGVLAIAALLIHGAAALGWLPPPRPALDMDRTVLVHQAEAARTPQLARTVVIGDSSGLMDVSAVVVSAGLEEPVRNLSTLSYVDLPTHARLLREYAVTNSGGLREVVLLLHPETLRLRDPSSYHSRQVVDFLEGRDAAPGPGVGTRLSLWLGGERLRGRCLSRWLPVPLAGEYGRFYGFTTDLERYLEAHGGSAVDPHTFDRQKAQGTAEYRLARRFELESRTFRDRMPSARLYVGLTPAPESFVGADHATAVDRLRTQWSAWLEPDGLLTNLPVTMPDRWFASVTHLNSAGSVEFSGRLAAEVKRARSLSGTAGAPEGGPRSPR